jgi:hypothetical protein
MQIQTQVEGLIPRIQSLSYENLKITAQIAELEKALAEVPVVVKMNADIARLKRQYEVNAEAEIAFREEGKEMMVSSGIKDFTMLDGTTIALHITPGSLTIDAGAVIPEEYYRVKKEVDKTALKKAFNDGKITDPNIYISKDYKFVIKSK